MPIGAMNATFTDAKCVAPQSETTIHEILDRTQTVVQDIHANVNCISGNLFGPSDIPPRPPRESSNATAVMMDILEELVMIFDQLNYITGRL